MAISQPAVTSAIGNPRRALGISDSSRRSNDTGEQHDRRVKLGGVPGTDKNCFDKIVAILIFNSATPNTAQLVVTEKVYLPRNL